MNILHINTLQTAGAALCAIRINNALVNEGVHSRMLFQKGDALPEGVDGAIAEEDKDFWHSNPLLLKVKYLLARTPLWRTMDKEKMEMILRRKNERFEKKLYLHGPFTSYTNIAHHPLIDWADIIHLHWVAHFVDYPTFFKDVKKPIVWTLHDKFPAVGVQHDCSDFHSLPDSLKEIDAYCRKVKRESVLQAQSINVVAISKVMEDFCNRSDVLQGFPITLVHNGVDTDVFHPYSKLEIRKDLGLKDDTTIFLFSANSLDDPNKGLDRVVKALEMLNRPNMLLICIGIHHPQKKLPQASFPMILAGYVSDQVKMAQYYSASDFFLNASYEETFGQTSTEAMACGTPVVGFPVGIMSELITKDNGVLCEDFTAESLKEGIEKALTMSFDGKKIREDICDRFDYKVIAKQYIKLYESILR